MTVATSPRLLRAIVRGFLGAAIAAMLITLPAQAQAAAKGQPKLTPALDSARTALDKYQDPMTAVRDGYLSTVACIEFPKAFTEGTVQVPAGAMGVHFINMSTIGPTLDPAKPQVLIYEPDGNKLKLVAAEWFMPAQVAGDTKPAIFGQALMGPMEGHPPIMPAELHHYDLHVWLWKPNPAGIYSPTNPDMKCGSYGYSFASDAPHMVGGHAH